MLSYPQIDPVIFSIGPLHLRWYGLMYVLGFLGAYLLVKKQIKEFGYRELDKHFENLNMILILSVVIGGRLGYVLFYNLPYYLEHPMEIPATWSGGMSFHGAALAILLSGLVFSYTTKVNFWKAGDIYLATVPIGLGLGRLGNFINGELYGRVTDVPWGMVFPEGGPLPRHPSQLYEAFLEGVVLFILLWSLRKKPWARGSRWPHGSITALFLIGYGVFRIIVENFREPDQHLGFLLGGLTMGQFLSLFMIGVAAVFWLILLRQNRTQ
jgi:phosphatidylglycerol:prolipoprotein diacylglycerol transferase